MNKVSTGFTLIELMIVVAIIGLLALVSAPFTSAWINSSKITKAESILAEAVGRAKAEAQRNELGAPRAMASASVCVNNNLIQVRQAGNAGGLVSSDCAGIGAVIWGANLPGGLAVDEAGGLAFAGLCFNNRGLVVLTGTCSSNGNLQITAGGESETVQYY